MSMSRKLLDEQQSKTRPSRQQRRRMWLFTAIVTLVVVCLCFGVVLFFLLSYGRDVVLPGLHNGIEVYDRRGNLVGLMEPDRIIVPVPLSKMSVHLRQAIVASEDHNFYHHHGIDWWGTLRAVFADLQAHKFVQGGSTLTQQLVKNLFDSGSERSLPAKLREARIAERIEEKYGKDKILETYLNVVYFGSGTYGAEQAAERYFGKPASQLSIAESAYLAGLVNAPTKLSADKTDAIERQKKIIDSMVKLQMITDAQAQAAKKQKLVLKNAQTNSDRCSYYLAYVRDLLKQKYDDELLYNKGLRVYTYLDVTAQALASQALTNGIRHAPKGVSQGALVSVSVADGGVMAMSGGSGTFQQSPWNRATSAHTAGSAFKPFVYLAGLITGVIKPDSMVEDAPLAVPTGTGAVYSPHNFDNKFMGLITIRKALALSRNTCAVRVGEAVTPQKVIETAQLAGISSRMDATPAVALGASAVSPLQMACAYSTLARGGVRMEPKFIREVDSIDGKPLEQAAPDAGKRVFDAEPVAELVDALQDVVQKGTGTHAKLFGRPVAGKTGTADGARDIWFIGFTPDTVTAVWGGNDQDQPIAGKQVTGGTIMAGIWQNYMKSYYDRVPTPAGNFAPPQTPLIVEPEALHFLPTPAGIFDNSQFVDTTEIPVAPQRKQRFINQEAPAFAPDRHDAQDQQEPRNPGKVKRFFKKLWKWF